MTTASDIARARGGRRVPGGGFLMRCPVPSHGQGRGDRNPSLTIKDGEKGLVVDCKCGCDWRDVLAALGCEPNDKTNGKPSGMNGFHHEPPKRFTDHSLTRDGFQQTAAYPYVDLAGKVLYEVLRYEHPKKKKTFLYRRPDGLGGWWSGAGSRKVLYRWPDLAKHGHLRAFIAEGEKDADRLASYGLLAVTVASGSWSQEAIESLKGYDCYVLEDNDRAGRAKALKAAEALHGVARSVRIVRLPGLPDGKDVSDWLDLGNHVQRLQEIAEAAPEWRPDGEQAAAKAKKTEDPGGRVLLSSAEFVAGFVPPDYLWDGILQRRFCYSLTASTGTGKTAFALLFTASTALGLIMSGRQVEQGRVLYFAGENPNDVIMRWIAMAEHMGFNINTIGVNFLKGVRNLDELEDKIRAECEGLGGAALVVVDTAAAYFLGDGENDNVQMGAYARRLRNLTTLPGGPTVLVNCHPTKNAPADNLLPRGGGAFLNEVDGNLTAAKSGTTTSLHWQGKFRGPDFEPMSFELVPVTAEQLKDSKGRSVPTVIARALSAAEQRAKASEGCSDEDAVLIVLLEQEDGMSYAAIAERLQWLTSEGQPQKSKLFGVVSNLRKDKLVSKECKTPTLTEKGKAAAKKARDNRDAARATYG